MIKSLSIRQNMALLTLMPLLLLAMLLEGSLLQGRYADLEQGLLDRGWLMARQLAASSEYGVFANNRDFLNNLALNALNQADLRAVTILDANDQVLTQAGEFSLSALQAHQHGAQSASQLTRVSQMLKTEGLDEHSPLRSDAQTLWIYQPILPTQVALDELAGDAAQKRTGAVIVEISKTRMQQQKSRVLWISLAVTALCLSLASYVVWLASRQIILPIRQLSHAVQNVAQGRLQPSLLLVSKITELSGLVSGMNDMMAMLQKDRAAMQAQIDAATLALREKKEQAEHATQQKSMFLAVASHDLRQPLHALGLYAAELRRQLAGAAEQPLVERIEQSVDALATLLNALLDISKLDAGAVTANMQSCPLTPIVNRVANDYRMLAQMKNIRLVVHPCTGWVYSDPVLLERILMNLVSNALRYTPENGCVMIACRKRGNQLRIEVRDNGVGISLADQAHIFAEFVQVEKVQLDSSKGLGLGLAIVDRLVRLLGHGIEVRSMPQRGSLFALQLPRAEAAARLSITGAYPALSASHVLENLPLRGKKLLVVDDDELVLTSTATILASWGGEVAQACDLQSVRALLENGAAWDLIISDYQLSATETGMDVIAAIRAHAQQEVKGILISGDTSPELLQRASSAGLHLMHKPVKPAKLRSLSLFLLNESNDS
ncbi:MAG: ATP-binding protein [Sideroxydans sp.]|nr:ATP-binding protein [Sideroxydans sp.]